MHSMCVRLCACMLERPREGEILNVLPYQNTAVRSFVLHGEPFYGKLLLSSDEFDRFLIVLLLRVLVDKVISTLLVCPRHSRTSMVPKRNPYCNLAP